MSFIFDNFPDRIAADAFANDARCLGPWYAQARTYDERRDDVDPFPFQLTPPVVYVDRHENEHDDAQLQAVLIRLAAGRGGRFAGT